MDPSLCTQPPELDLPTAATTDKKKRRSKLKSSRHYDVTQDQVEAALAASRARVRGDVSSTRVDAVVDLTASPQRKFANQSHELSSVTPTPVPTSICNTEVNENQLDPTLTDDAPRKRLKVREGDVLGRISLDVTVAAVKTKEKRLKSEPEKVSKAARVSIESVESCLGKLGEDNKCEKVANTKNERAKAPSKSQDKSAAAKKAAASSKSSTAKKESTNSAVTTENPSVEKSPQQKEAETKKTKSQTVDATKSAVKTQALQPSKTPAKKKKRSFHDQILYTMLTSSRPYTLKSLAKTCNTTTEALNHAMLSFLDKQLVICKEFPSKKGEKKLYWANPLSHSELSGKTAVAKEMSKLLASENEMVDAKKMQHELNQKLRVIQEELQPMLAIQTMKELNDEISTEETQLQQLQLEMNAIRHRIETASKPKSQSVSRGRFKKPPSKPRTKSSLKRSINHYTAEYKKRKRTCMDFIDNLADAMEKKVKDTTKLLDLETDEMEWGCWKDLGTNKIYGGKKGKGVVGEEDVCIRIPAKYDV